MTFADPRWLVALVAIPLWGLLEVWTARRADAAARRLVGERGAHALLGQIDHRARWLMGVLRTLALAFLVLGAARPEWGREVTRRGATGSDVVLAIDVSASMDARDVLPSRLDEARREALAVLDRLGGSRVGVIAFAGDAIRLTPLTLDRAAARLTVEAMGSGSVSEPGTDVGRALRTARRMLPEGRRDEQAIVLWTDGEDLERGARDAVEEFANAGIRVFVVGVGTPAGDVVPVLDDQGRAVDVKRDEEGNAVRSRLDEELLRHVARRTRGAYFAASRPGGELPRLLAALGSVAQAGRGDRLVERPVARFPLCAALAAALLVAERLIARRRRRVVDDALATPAADAAPAERDRKRRRERERRGAGVAPAPVTALALAVLAGAPDEVAAQSAWARGNAAYKKGDYAAAESLYSRRLGDRDVPAVRLNRALARAHVGDPKLRTQAIGELDQLAQRDDPLAAEAAYDGGTLLGEANEYDRALASLRRALERDPADEDARWNYELLRRRQQERQQQPRPEPEPEPTPQPQQPQPQQPQPQPGAAPQPQQQQQDPQPRPSRQMTPQQAEQILDALQELQRMEQQRQRKVRVLQERRGRDW